MSRPLKVLAIEPYYTGSHRAFIDGWIENSGHDWTLLTLPGYHWKWRMRHSALLMASAVGERLEASENWDVVFATDMLNVAEFRGLVDPSVAGIPHVLYFHENQFSYPNTREDPRDLHFGFSNLISAVAADSVWFNSEFNRQSFLDCLDDLMPRWPDYPPVQERKLLESNSRIEYPAIALPGSLKSGFSAPDQPIHLIWAARWEHDKQPEQLLEALRILRESGTEFRLSVVGESFRNVPESFAQIRAEFSDQLRRFGYQESRKEYFEALCEADIFVSTASHEFFGLSAVEAVVAGLHPLLPDRLAYPEVLGTATNEPERFMYEGTAESLANSIARLDRARSLLSNQLASRFADKFAWGTRAPQLDEGLSRISRV
ncbi:MAG: DUF3524 domain-containing protein [Planctomycetota bacterium]